MKKPLAALAMTAMLSAAVPALALEQFDACLTPGSGSSTGTVESVREVVLARDLHAFDAEVLEHAVQPLTAEELTVRLDIGPRVVFTQRQFHRLRAGQRVRVTLDGSGALVEMEQCPAPLARRHAQRLS